MIRTSSILLEEDVLVGKELRVQWQQCGAEAAFIDVVRRAEGLATEQVEPIERFAFYERVGGASLIVQSGEASAYGNAIVCKGVIALDRPRHSVDAGLA